MFLFSFCCCLEYCLFLVVCGCVVKRLLCLSVIFGLLLLFVGVCACVCVVCVAFV